MPNPTYPPYPNLADDVLEILHDTDEIPSEFGLRPTLVTLVIRTYLRGYASTSPGDYQDGPPLVFPRSTKVRHVTTREIASSEGLYEVGDVIVGGAGLRPQVIRSDGVTIGFTEDQIAPVKTPLLQTATRQGVEALYLLTQKYTGQSGIAGTYFFKSLQRDKSLRYLLVLSRTRRTP